MGRISNMCTAVGYLWTWWKDKRKRIISLKLHCMSLFCTTNAYLDSCLPWLQWELGWTEEVQRVLHVNIWHKEWEDADGGFMLHLALYVCHVVLTYPVFSNIFIWLVQCLQCFCCFLSSSFACFIVVCFLLSHGTCKARGDGDTLWRRKEHVEIFGCIF